MPLKGEPGEPNLIWNNVDPDSGVSSWTSSPRSTPIVLSLLLLQLYAVPPLWASDPDVPIWNRSLPVSSALLYASVGIPRAPFFAPRPPEAEKWTWQPPAMRLYKFVTIDFALTSETIASERRDAGQLASEILRNVKADCGSAIEGALSVRRDRGVNLEVGGAMIVTADGRINIEIARGMRNDVALASESLLSATANQAAQFEKLSGVVGDLPQSIAIVLRVAGDANALTEVISIVFGVSSGALISVGTTASVRNDAALASESLLSASGNSAAVLEQLLAILREYPQPIEVTLTLAAPSGTAIEMTGVLVIAADGRINIEITSSVESDAALVAEGLLAIASDYAPPIEILVTVAGESDAAMESVGTLIAIFADGVLQIEVLGLMSADQVAALSSQMGRSYAIQITGSPPGTPQ